MPDTTGRRMNIYIQLRDLIGNRNVNLNSLVKDMSKQSEDFPSYGIANEVDFRELAPLFARLFAFNNKHYYVYKAISNPNKIGFLSRKQYFQFQLRKENWRHRGIAGSSFSAYETGFLERHGTMASPYKLIKRSFKENIEASRFLSRFFPLSDDKKTTLNEDKLIALCDAMMQLNTGVEIVPASIQECYNLDFHGSNINNSGERHCANSCMHGKKVGAFYDAFGAEGRMVYYRGQPVGRFLLWKFDAPIEGHKGYIDRLYIRGEYINEALAQIDSEFPDGEWYKYPYLRTHSDRVLIEIPVKFSKKLLENPETPYIDTFAYLKYDPDSDTYFLSNDNDIKDPDGNSRKYFVNELRRTSTQYKMKSCEYCDKVYYTGNAADSIGTSSQHRLYCSGYQPRTKELQAYLKIFRDGIKHIKEVNQNAQSNRTELVFEI